MSRTYNQCQFLYRRNDCKSKKSKQLGKDLTLLVEKEWRTNISVTNKKVWGTNNKQYK